MNPTPRPFPCASAKVDCARLESIVARFAELRVLVVGDLLLDEYRSGDVERISPEAPVPIVHVRSTRSELGGAGNVARGIVALGAPCSLVAAAGCDAEGDRTVDLLDAIGIAADGVVRTPGRSTPHKIRVVARGQQMLRIDREEAGPLAPESAARIREAIAARLDGVDVVILQDYDKGLFGEGLGSWLIERARRGGVPVVADPKNDLRRFHGASLIKPNLDEARDFQPGSIEDFVGRRALLEKIQRELGGAEIVMTRGAEGMSAVDGEGWSVDIPTRVAEVFDVQGAGDTTIAVLALCRAAGASLLEACIVANAAAANVVGKMGTAAVDADELRAGLGQALAIFRASVSADGSVASEEEA